MSNHDLRCEDTDARMKAPAMAGKERLSYRVAIDTGGTFTDVAVARPDGGMFVWKVPSQPEAPDDAVVEGLTEALGLVGAKPQDVGRFVHGMTVATNALLTRTGARVGLVTTAGFRDILGIGRQTRPSIYDLQARRPSPLVSRAHTWEVAERIAADGTVIQPLDEGELRRLEASIRRAGCEVVVVSFLNAYVNPIHERRCAALLEEVNVAPRVFAATGACAEMREFERTSTAVLNAYVQPAIATYVERLDRRVMDLGLGTRLWIMQSNGGLLGARSACEECVRTILSGPAGGVMGAAHWARTLGLTNVVSFDMGGTSTDIALVRNGVPDTMTSGEVEGYALQLPAVGVHTIGAGGGSVVWRDPGGGLRVGPASAGADPGPVCYPRGGSKLTVTDAHLLLGRLGRQLLDGRLVLDRQSSRRVLATCARDFGMLPDETAAGIIRVITATMARGVRKVSVERGIDIRDCWLIAFGGAGPLHAGDLIRELGMRGAVVPPHPGIASAIGMLEAAVRHDFAANVADPTADPNEIARVTPIVDELTKKAFAFMRDEEGLPHERIVVEQLVDARYWGQSYELTIPWCADIGVLRSAFDAAHDERYGYADPHAVLELVTARVTASAHLPAAPAPERLGGGPPPEPSTRREVYVDGRWRETPVYRRERIPARCELEGPLVIEQLDSTVMALPGQLCCHDERGFLHIREATS